MALHRSLQAAPDVRVHPVHQGLMDHHAGPRPRLRRVPRGSGQLNMHYAGSDYEQFEVETAHDRPQFYRFHFTPKGARRAELVEIEISAIVRKCLGRRITNQDTVEREVTVSFMNATRSRSQCMPVRSGHDPREAQPALPNRGSGQRYVSTNVVDEVLK